jgi:hypothetical protein
VVQVADDLLDDGDQQLLDEFLRRVSRPGDMTRAQQDALLSNPLFVGLGRALGVDVDHVMELHRDARESALASVTAAGAFARFGWAVSARAPHRHGYVEAVKIWEKAGDQAAVDECLTRWWNDGRAFLRGTFGPLLPLAGRHEATLGLLLERNRILTKALAHHEAGEYEASVLIILSQIDGLVLDFTDPPFGFFYKPRDDMFEDDATVAGMPVILRAVWRAVIHSTDRTTISDAFERSPIIHGRHLGYGTQTNSTKAFALLAAVIDWLKPKAHALTERWQAEHEARYAGSDELDADGRRMDQRGFAETRESLRWLAIRQANEIGQHGTYRSDVKLMFPDDGIGMLGGAMSRRDAIHLVVSEDHRSWWYAWARTDSDFCFGIAGQAGESGNRYYAGLGPPGPLSEDDRWAVDADRPPDWDSA